MIKRCSLAGVPSEDVSIKIRRLMRGGLKRGGLKRGGLKRGGLKRRGLKRRELNEEEDWIEEEN